MFDKIQFSNILKKINNEYSNMTEFAKKAELDRSYISKYIHTKLDNPPTPKILMGIANASNGLFNYYELMMICGYVTNNTVFQNVNNTLEHPSDFFVVPLMSVQNGKLYETNEDITLPNNLDTTKQYFGYKVTDESMLPLLGIGDIAIIEKTNEYKSGQTCLICIDDNTVMIRKIIDYSDFIELNTAFPYTQPIKLTKKDIKIRKFTILGRIIKAENTSAFK